MSRIRKGDQVIVISGRDKGRSGTVLRVIGGDHVIVESINRVKRHTRPNPQVGKQGGIVEKEMALPISKVAIFNPGSKQGDRIGYKQLADGKKVRFFKSNGEMLDA